MKVGEVKIIKQIVRWRECDECGLPASFRITFLVDDCPWCSDAEAYACKRHERAVRASPPDGMTWRATFPLTKFKHMGFYLVTLP